MQRCKHTQRHTGISPKSTPDFEHGSYMYTSHTNMCACNITYMIDNICTYTVANTSTEIHLGKYNYILDA